MKKNLIPVVNEKDRITGYIDRQKVRKGIIYRVSAIWITDEEDNVLLARRAKTKSHDPLKWGPAVAGTVEKGETYRQNIIKEAEEEIGLKNIRPEKGPKFRVSRTYDYFGQWYFLTIGGKTKFRIKKDEVEEIKWFPKKELLAKIKKNREEFLGGMPAYCKLFLEKSKLNLLTSRMKLV
ncbi:MAG: NUDIX hydrolase [archaeon]